MTRLTASGPSFIGAPQLPGTLFTHNVLLMCSMNGQYLLISSCIDINNLDFDVNRVLSLD